MTSKQTDRLGTAPEEGMKAPVVVATIANLTLEGLPTISLIELESGDRVLVKEQTDATENGIYDAAAGSWARSTDWNKVDDVIAGQLVIDANSGLLYRTNFSGEFELDTTETTFIVVDTDSASRHFDKVSDMVADTTIQLGDYLDLGDYDTDNKAGPLFFKAVAAATGTADGGSYIDLPNTTPVLQAKQNFPGYADIKMFGAAEGASDALNSTAIQATIDYAIPVRISEGTFTYDTGLTNPDLVPIFGQGKLKFSGSGENAFVFGDTSTSHINQTSMPSNIWVERATQDFTDEFGGVVLDNTFQMSLTVKITDFWHGLKLRGTNSGCNYNKIFIDSIEQCHSYLVLHASTGGNCNQSTFYAGRWHNLQATSEATDLHAVEFINDSGNIVNGHEFINPSFELYNTGAGSSSAFHGSTNTAETTIAQRNRITGYRIEQTEFLLSGKGIKENFFESTYDGANITTVREFLNGDTELDNRTLANNRFTFARPNIYSDRPYEIARIGRENVVHSEDGSSNEFASAPAIGGVWDESAHTWLKRVRAVTNHDNFVMSLGANIDVWGVLFDMTNVQESHIKRMDLKLHTETDGGRFVAVCFDSSFELLSAGEECSLVYFGTGEYYRAGTDTTVGASERTVTFGPNVAYAFVGVANGTAAQTVQSLSYHVLAQADIKIVYDSDLYDDISQANAGGANLHPCYASPQPRSEVIPEVPNAGNSYPEGLFCKADVVVEAGGVGVAYLINGWIYDADTTTWYESRTLTGN